MNRLALALVLALTATQAWSESTPQPTTLGPARTHAEFSAQAEKIRAQMEPGGTYSTISRRDRKEVDTLLASMGKRLQAVPSVEALPPEDVAKVTEEQQKVNAILTKRPGDRVVCERKRGVNSRIPGNDCKSAAQRLEEQEQAREFGERNTLNRCANENC
ncbi:hypothetical protein ACQQ2N_12420 [Dokdonella sp. MW10]|uniref:hypothetical protein n=1 Tax=Dokdonella sp. MW10 TaxID=2992926 RepID=UPI003F7D1CD2